MINSLIEARTSILKSEKEIQIDEVKGLHKLSPWHFAPSIHYDPINSKYYVSVSTAHLVQHFLAKRQETKQISSIERRHKIKTVAETIKIKKLYAAILIDIQDIEQNQKILETDKLIYNIKKQQYNNNEIDTETFMREKSTILTKIKNHNTTVFKTQKNILELETVAETEFELNIDSLKISITDI